MPGQELISSLKINSELSRRSFKFISGRKLQHREFLPSPPPPSKRDQLWPIPFGPSDLADSGQSIFGQSVYWMLVCIMTPKGGAQPQNKSGLEGVAPKGGATMGPKISHFFSHQWRRVATRVAVSDFFSDTFCPAEFSLLSKGRWGVTRQPEPKRAHLKIQNSTRKHPGNFGPPPCVAFLFRTTPYVVSYLSTFLKELQRTPVGNERPHGWFLGFFSDTFFAQSSLFVIQGPPGFTRQPESLYVHN